jgi:hypothetical protein
MKTKASGPTTLAPEPVAKPASKRRPGRIHPVVIFPYRAPDDYSDLERLYELVRRLDEDRVTYRRPITVIDRKTHRANLGQPRYREFRENVVARNSDLLDVWCVDTCQMWYSGLGEAFGEGQEGDVYWLIPGDFNYGSPVGQEVLGRLHDLPEICLELQQDVCVGEIETDHNNHKHLIDIHGTFALLYNWFPKEAQEIRQYTERPRSEFFAVRHSFLDEILRHRWYAYEQTLVILLHAIFGDRAISRFNVGGISDLPEGRESLPSALQQVERTERVLKAMWRERHQAQPDWLKEYQALESQSESIRRAAFVILRNLLG